MRADLPPSGFARLAASAALLALLSLFLSGCGYRLVGARPAGELQGLWIGPVEDVGDLPLFGSYLRSALARDAVDQPGKTLASRESAKALLTGRVVSVKENAVAYVAPDRPREYLLKAEVEATLSRPDGKVLWKSTKIHAERQFASGTTIEATQRNKQVAAELLARDVSHEILRRVALTLERDVSR